MSLGYQHVILNIYIVINVNESKENILILFNSPHPDISTIQSVLKKNPNYEVEFSSIDKFNKSILKYNLVILHQLPSMTSSITNLLNEIIDKKVPTLFILGSQSSLNYL